MSETHKLKPAFASWVRLSRHLAAALRWGTFVPAGVLALGFGLAAAQGTPNPSSRHIPLRLALIALAMGLAFTLDDPARELSGAAPSPLWIRQLMRPVLVGIPWIVNLVVVVELGGWGVKPSAWPASRFWLEGLTLAACGLGLAALLSRTGNAEPGRNASLALLGLVALFWFLPKSARVFVEPETARWNTVEPLWWASLLLASATLFGASWDSMQGSARWWISRMSVTEQNIAS